MCFTRLFTESSSIFQGLNTNRAGPGGAAGKSASLEKEERDIGLSQRQGKSIQQQPLSDDTDTKQDQGEHEQDYYQAHAQDFADAESRDSSGNWTLTMVIDPGEESERTFRVPMNAGEDLQNRAAGYTSYWDREGTRKIDLETGSAELEALTARAADTTIYLISNNKKDTSAPTEPVTDPDATTESTSPDPGAVADLPDGYYSIWTYVNSSEELFPQYERNYNALMIDHTEGEEITVTQKSNGLYIKLTKDHFETTFPLDGENGQIYYNKEEEVVRVPVSPVIQDDFAQYVTILEWIFTEGAFELFSIYVQDGMVDFIGTVS